MKNKCKKTSGKFGIFLIFLADFLKFLILFLIMTFGLILVMSKLLVDTHNFTISDYTKNLSFLENKEYSHFPCKDILGENGFFIILNSDYNLVYNSSDKKIEVDEYTLNFIPVLESKTSIYVNEFFNNKEGKKYFIEYYTQSNIDRINLNYLVLDRELNIESSSFTSNITMFSKTQFNSIFGFNWPNSDVKRSSYYSGDELYHIIMYRDNYEKSARYKRNKLVVRFITVIYLLSVGGLLIFFIFNLYKKVKRPIDFLNEAISDFSKGNYKDSIDYKGPREFTEICSNFNDMADKLNQTELQQIKAKEAKQKMLSDISHDLKTPITIIQGYAKAIEDNKISGADLNDYLKSIRVQSELLTSLINRFSEFNKLDRPDFKLKTKRTDICEFSRKFLIEQYNNLELLGFTLDIEIPDSSIYVNLDEFNFSRVFQNIISNSIKYNENGTNINFNIQVNNDNDSVIITLSDDGVGIPDNIKDSLFEAFTVGDDSRTVKLGTGLGLAIVKKIVNLHEGTINLVYSNDETTDNGNNGSTYKITLPRA